MVDTGLRKRLAECAVSPVSDESPLFFELRKQTASSYRGFAPRCTGLSNSVPVADTTMLPSELTVEVSL